jgi:hypothetical protein
MSAVGDPHRGAKGRANMQWFPDLDIPVAFCHHARPKLDEMLFFAGEVMPLIRRKPALVVGEQGGAA